MPQKYVIPSKRTAAAAPMRQSTQTPIATISYWFNGNQFLLPSGICYVDLVAGARKKLNPHGLLKEDGFNFYVDTKLLDRKSLQRLQINGVNIIHNTESDFLSSVTAKLPFQASPKNWVVLFHDDNNWGSPAISVWRHRHGAYTVAVSSEPSKIFTQLANKALCVKELLAV